MDPTSASAQLQTIRTLMERVALYRRALAPCSFVAGGAGTLAALAGWGFHVNSAAGFLILWLSTALATLSAVLLFMRRDAIHAAEPFWTPPTRRVGAAFLPPMAAAALGTASISAFTGPEALLVPATLPALWMACYGLGLHAAGFFMPRGIRWLGWIFLAASALSSPLLARTGLQPPSSFESAHLAMGIAFGLVHLAYAVYLRITQAPASL